MNCDEEAVAPISLSLLPENFCSLMATVTAMTWLTAMQCTYFLF